MGEEDIKCDILNVDPFARPDRRKDREQAQWSLLDYIIFGACHVPRSESLVTV
jgi:hypothetical protein